MVASVPLISVTSPSIQANSGSSAQTCDPTIMLMGVPWIIEQVLDCSFVMKNAPKVYYNGVILTPNYQELTIVEGYMIIELRMRRDLFLTEGEERDSER